MSEITREQFAHFSQLATRWGDEDRLGHVNNAKFFTYDESARLEYFERLAGGDAGFWQGSGLILAHVGCDFLQQLHHPATLDIGIRITTLGRTSLRTQGAMFVGERLMAVTRSVIVWFDFHRQRAVPVPEPVKQAIRAFERMAPEEK